MVESAGIQSISARPARTRSRQLSRRVERPALRIRVDATVVRRHPRRNRTVVRTSAVVADRPVIRLQPIVSKPLQPYVLRESACGYLECRTAGRRCLAASRREVTLGYQVAYCLGSRHESCPHFHRITGRRQSGRMKKVAYAAAVVVLFGLVLAAVIQAVGSSGPVEFGRVVGLG